MSLLQQAISDNKFLLQELNCLLGSIGQQAPDFYQQESALLNAVSVGSHIRHLLEHYQNFFKALSVPEPVNYDQRQRCPDCQSSIAVAQKVISDIVHELNAMPAEDDSLMVSIITNPDITDMASQSSVLREMQFLQSHALHHLAIIGIALRESGIEVNNKIIKAPSTRQYESRNQ